MPLRRTGRLALALIAIGCTILLSAVGLSGIQTGLAKDQDAIKSSFMDKVPKTTVITDRNDETLYYLYKDTNRIVIPGNEIPQTMKDAVIAAEDERFYYHGGFDLISAFRALTANLTHHHILSGGSTLTMQLVKNITGDDRRTWQRKIKEAYLANQLEHRYSKDQVLTMYLNIVPLGGNIAGVETASQLYFHKPAKDLTLAESASLAALISSPNHYANNPDALKTRRGYVLNRMVATGKITKEASEKATAETVALAKPAVPFKAAHFTDAVVAQLKSQYGDKVYTQGLHVTTTLDIPTQMLAEQTIKDNRSVLSNVRADTVGMVVASPKNGDVLAMVGSPDYFKGSQVNVTTAPLSYGSTGKPLIYSLLLEKENMSPGMIMWDVKTSFPIKGSPTYTPVNYDGKFFGPLTLREALGTSRNIPAIKALQMVGLDSVLKRLRDYGITSLSENPTDYGPSLAIGGGGIPLTQMVGAYTAFANNGKVNPTHLISKVTNYQGKTLQEYQAPNKEVIKPEVAYEIADILQDNNARKREFGTNSQLVVKGHTVAAKTGTSQDFRTALTIGFTPDVVIGVIVANNDNSPLRSGSQGAMAAAPFFNNFMSHYLDGKPDSWFNRPDTLQNTQFATIIGQVNDLTASWQSPTDRFTKRIAEIDDPNWNRAVASASRPKEEPKPSPSIIEEQQTVLVNVEPPSEPTPQETTILDAPSSAQAAEPAANQENQNPGNNGQGQGQGNGQGQ